MKALMQRGFTWLRGFLEERMPQSSTRLIAVLFTLAAVCCAPAAIVFAFKHPHEWQSIAAIGGTTITALVGGVSVALAVRTRNDPAAPSGGDQG